MRDERQPVDSPAAWRAADVADTPEWTVVLTDDQRATIAHAANQATERGLTTATLTRDGFALPGFDDIVEDWVDQLNTGRIPKRRDK